jgi:hypothetical protein
MAALLAWCGGCGGNGGGGSCGSVEPCGGSLVGDWTVQSVCQTMTFDADCPGASVDSSMLSASGSLAFNADMTFAVDWVQAGTLKFKIPLTCAVPPTSCDEIASQIYFGPPGATTTCETVGTTCDCAMVYSQPPIVTATGTYSTAGNNLLPDAGPLLPAGYCVQGNTLHLRETSVVQIISGMLGEIDSYTVATR